MKEKYYWLTGGWFDVREKHWWLVG